MEATTFTSIPLPVTQAMEISTSSMTQSPRSTETLTSSASPEGIRSSRQADDGSSFPNFSSVYKSIEDYSADVSIGLKKLYIKLVKSNLDVIKKSRDRKQYGSNFLMRVSEMDLDDDDTRSKLSFADQRKILKGLLTIHNVELEEEIVEIVERILKHENSLKTITSPADLTNSNKLSSLPRDVQISVWRGDIATLQVDAIVNAANMQMEGCFVPFHACIDNVIHDRAGPRLRSECRVFMEAQGHLEETGTAKITKAYCLPSKHVLHTVGPIIDDNSPELKPDLLSSCYRSCLDLSEENKLSSVAFCCISTGVFGYPKLEAAHVALETVRVWMLNHNSGNNQRSSVRTVIFNVFTEDDAIIYNNLIDSYYSDKSGSLSSSSASL